MEGIKKGIDNAASKKDYELLFSNMVIFIEAAIIPPKEEIKWNEVAWFDFVSIYYKAIELNSPTLSFPFLQERQKEEKKLPWEYEGRAWFFWLNLFAKNYGWDEKTIEELDIDTALGAMQEIFIDEQMEKEWDWGLSEIAYPYDTSTKKSKFKPLDRPAWMMPIIPKQMPTVRMHRKHLPIGNIIDLQAQEADRKKKKDGI